MGLILLCHTCATGSVALVHKEEKRQKFGLVDEIGTALYSKIIKGNENKALREKRRSWN